MIELFKYNRRYFDKWVQPWFQPVNFWLSMSSMQCIWLKFLSTHEISLFFFSILLKIAKIKSQNQIMRTMQYCKIKKLKRKSITEVTVSVICHGHCRKSPI